MSELRRNRRITKALAGVAAGSLLLAGCGSKEPTVTAAPTSVSPTISAEATPTTVTPTTTETVPTTTEATPSTSATAEIVTTPTLCGISEKLGITAMLGEATCTPISADNYFVKPIDGAHWQSSKGDMDVKVFEGEPNASKFAVLGGFHAKNIQSDQRKPYGLENFNAVCSPDACYAPDESSQGYDGQKVLYEVAGGTQVENLTVLGNLANSTN
jgi:hypothetical protein